MWLQLEVALKLVGLLNHVEFGVWPAPLPGLGFVVWHFGRMSWWSELFVGRFSTAYVLFIPASAASKAVKRDLLNDEVRWPALVYWMTVTTMIEQTVSIPIAITSAIPRSSSRTRPRILFMFSLLLVMTGWCS